MIKAAVHTIRDRSLRKGGFALYTKESFRPDASAWAVIALEAYNNNRDLTIPTCRRLAEMQLSDGRIPIIEDHPESYWPTALAVLAWKKVTGFERQVELALQFLLTTTGRHWPKQKDAPVSHDTSIKGWPWIENTHSWIEPGIIGFWKPKEWFLTDNYHPEVGIMEIHGYSGQCCDPAPCARDMP
jgi:hypothetical protein